MSDDEEMIAADDLRREMILRVLRAEQRAQQAPSSSSSSLPLGVRVHDPLHGIIRSGDTAALRRFHKESGPVDMDQPWSQRHPHLVIQVARDGHAEMLQFMIDCGADLDVLTSFGGSLMMSAVYTNHYDVCRVLARAGVSNINQQSGWDQATALHLARDVRTARLLITQCGADWRLRNAHGHTPREAATEPTPWGGHANNEGVAGWLGRLEAPACRWSASANSPRPGAPRCGGRGEQQQRRRAGREGRLLPRKAQRRGGGRRWPSCSPARTRASRCPASCCRGSCARWSITPEQLRQGRGTRAGCCVF